LLGRRLLGAGWVETRMSKFEEFRKNAEEARRQADRAEIDEIRAAWLQLVQGWLALMPKRDLSREHAFDAELKA
jgi:16S rRNA U1498 N3-methylase RsmE